MQVVWAPCSYCILEFSTVECEFISLKAEAWSQEKQNSDSKHSCRSTTEWLRCCNGPVKVQLQLLKVVLHDFPMNLLDSSCWRLVRSILSCSFPSVSASGVVHGLRAQPQAQLHRVWPGYGERVLLSCVQRKHLWSQRRSRHQQEHRCHYQNRWIKSPLTTKHSSEQKTDWKLKLKFGF